MDISAGRNIISRPCITVKYYQRYLSQEQHGKSYDIMIECLSKAYLKNWSSRFFFHYFDSFAGEICRRLNYSNFSIPCKNLLEYRTTHTSFGAYMILLGYLPLLYFPWLSFQLSCFRSVCLIKLNIFDILHGCPMVLNVGNLARSIHSSNLSWAEGSLGLFVVVVVFVVNFSHFLSSFPEPIDQFQPNMAQSILGERKFKFVQMKGYALF